MEKEKIVYAYDQFTNEFIGVQIAHLCPETKESYLMPAFCVEVEPPVHKEGFARVLSGGVWIYVEDKRGTPVYECSSGNIAFAIDSLSYALPEGFTEKAPKKGEIWSNGKWVKKPSLTKEEKKALRKMQIQIAMREEADPLFFEAEAGEIDKQVWLDKRAEIKQRFSKED